MIRTLILLSVLGAFVVTQLACEGKVDEDGAKVKVDTDN